MRAKAAAFTLASLLVSSSVFASDTAPRIASTSLCGDSYLLHIAPDHAAALSWQSRDSLSLATAQQRKLPQVSDDIETLLALNPTHVIFGPGEGAKTAKVLEARGIKIIRLEWADSAEGAVKNLRMARTAIFPDRQTDWRAKDFDPMEHDLNQMENWIESWMFYADRGFEQPPLSPKILYLSRSGGTAGPGTFIDDIIHMKGGKNIITREGWFTPETEYLLTLKPDLIVTSFEGGYESAQAKAVRNKTLQDMIERTHHVDVPGKFLVCAGPTIIDAARAVFHVEAFGYNNLGQ